MRTSVRVNNDLRVDEVLALAEAAERAGFDQLWISHDLFQRSAPVLLAAAAARTERLHLGIGIANPYTVHPAELAMFAATMQEYSAGRFLLGLSAGAEDFLGWVGITHDRPLTRTAQALRAIRALLNGERPADTDGVGPGWSDAAFLRTPPASTRIYLGAMSPRMLRLAGAEADGVLPLLFPPEHFVTARSHITQGMRDAGRNDADVDIAACFWCSVDADADAARSALARKLAYYGPAFSPYLLRRAGIEPDELEPIRQAVERGRISDAVRLVDERLLGLGIAGGVDDLIARCRRIMQLGATHLSFGPPLGPDPVAALELLGRSVLPALREQQAA